MIIVKIYGGLGNQMFQYSAAKRLALKHKTEMKLYPLFENDKQREYKLDVFNIFEEFATNEETDKITLSFKKYNKLIHKIKRKADVLKPYYKKRVYKYRPWTNDKGILKSPDNIILDGYWANEIFFKDIRKQLLEVFTIKKKYITKQFVDLKNEIVKQNAVSVHIRRGDYVKKKENSAFFGLLPVEYYQKAISYIKNKYSNCVFYVFSDDIDYVKTNFNFGAEVIYVENKDLQDYHELKLMSFCKHNIIANSTFSWWAAWLNENPDKMVIAPRKWYNNEKAQSYYEKYSFVPETWIKL